MSATKAGEFFVALGLKGNEKTAGEIDKTSDSFKNLKTVSTEAKIAILAVLYGVERMVSTYGVAGTQLTNFSTITGISTRTLQEYEIAAQKAGAANREFSKTLDSLQQMMFGVQTGQTKAPWLQVITGTLQGQGVKFTPEEMQDTALAWGKHPELLAQRLSAFAQNKLLQPFQTKNILQQAGIPDNIIAGMMRGYFNDQSLKQAGGEILSGNTIGQLTQLNKEWTDLIFKFKQFMATLTGAHLGEFVHDLNDMATQLFRIGNALDKIGTKFGAFKPIGQNLKNTTTFFSVIADLMGGDLKQVKSDLRAWADEPFQRGKKMGNNINTIIHQHIAPEIAKDVGKMKRALNEAIQDIPNFYSAKAGN